MSGELVNRYPEDTITNSSPYSLGATLLFVSIYLIDAVWNPNVVNEECEMKRVIIIELPDSSILFSNRTTLGVYLQ